MTTTVHNSVRFTPQEVREVLSRHILVDGYHMVQDIEKSHGVYLHDAVRGRDVLDFFRAQGRGYQTLINAILRSYVDQAARGRRRAG